MKTISIACLSILLASTMGAVPTTTSSSRLEMVLNLYLNIQIPLARDLMKNISTNANAIAAVVRCDKTKSIPASIGEQEGTLAKAKHIRRDREAFKILSQSLIARLRADPVACPAVEEAQFGRARIEVVK